MLNFLCQVDTDGDISFDFVFELKEAQKYWKWRDNTFNIKYVTYDHLTSGLKDISDNFIPVGSVEFFLKFCSEYINPKASELVRPLNVPDVLTRFGGRQIADISADGNTPLSDYLPFERLFVKSSDRIKSDRNGIYRSTDILPEGNYQISSLIDIESEYRCFVYKGELMGIQYYSGSFRKYPDITEIDRMLKAYDWREHPQEVPQAMTLDVAVTTEGRTVVVECHEFFSCGLYGFSDYQNLPYMFARTFQDIRRRLTQSLI